MIVRADTTIQSLLDRNATSSTKRAYMQPAISQASIQHCHQQCGRQSHHHHWRFVMWTCVCCLLTRVTAHLQRARLSAAPSGKAGGAKEQSPTVELPNKLGDAEEQSPAAEMPKKARCAEEQSTALIV